MSDDLMDHLQQPRIKKLVLDNDITDFKLKDKSGTYYHKFLRFERAFLTVKNNPKTTYHAKSLTYPEKVKLSDFITGIHIYPWKPGQKNPTPSGKLFFSTMDINEDIKKKLGISEEYYGLRWTIYCDRKEGYEIDFLTAGLGSFAGHSRPDGLLIIAQSSNHIGENWLGIVKEFDVPVTIHEKIV